MNKPLFDLERADLQVVVNKVQPGTGLAWSTLFPLKYTRRFDLKGLEGNEGIAVSADRVAFNAKAPLKTREKVGSWSGKLAKIAVSRIKDEEDINDYNELKVLAAASGNPQEAQQLLDMTYDDVTFCGNAMSMRNEIDALGIGCSGKKQYKVEIDGENATADEINFNVPADNFKGAVKAWTTLSGKNVVVNEDADGLGDFIKAQAQIAKLGMPKPMFAIMEKEAFDALTQQKKTANRLYPQAKDLTLVTADMIDLASINKYMQRNNYPTLVVIDTYARVEGKDGSYNVIKPWNPNVVTLAPSIQLGWTYYKDVPNVENVEALQVQGAFYKVTRYSDINPMTECTMAEAYVQPALINRRSTIFLNVNNTAWNGGER